MGFPDLKLVASQRLPSWNQSAGGSPVGFRGHRQAVHVHPDHLSAQEQERAEHTLLLGHVPEEAPHPVRVAALCAVGVVPCANPRAQVIERRQWIGPTLRVHDGAARPPMPVGSLEEVDEVNAERLFGLAHLPLLTLTAALQCFAEPAHLVRQRVVRRRAREELFKAWWRGPRQRNRRTQRTQYGAAFSVTSRALRTNSPNCCNDVSSSRMTPLAIGALHPSAG